MAERANKFQLRFTEPEFALLKKASEVSGRSMSELIRLTVIAGAQAIIDGDEEKYKRIINNTGKLVFSSMAIKQDTSG